MTRLITKTLFATAVFLSAGLAAHAQPTAFTYQGELVDSGVPANGPYDFEFALFNALTGGSQLGSTLTVDDLLVLDGVFQTDLDFGAAPFDGSQRWLEISVRTGASTGAFTTLAPRAEITSVPYAIYAANAGNATTADTAQAVAPGAITSTSIADGTIEKTKFAPGLRNTLDAADGTPMAAVFVDNDGLVGIGTQQPTASLTIGTRPSDGEITLRQVGKAEDGVGAFTLLDNPWGVFVKDRRAYLSSAGDDALTIVDVSAPSSLQLLGVAQNGVGFTDLNAARYTVVDDNDVAYVLSGVNREKLTLIDVSDPTAPVELSHVTNGVGGVVDMTNTWDVFVTGGRAYLASGTNGVIILDVSNSAAPSQLGVVTSSSTTFMSEARGVVVDGTTAYVTSRADNSVTVLDVSNPAIPLELAALQDGVGGFNRLGGAWALTLDRSVLYVCAYLDEAVSIIDVSNPSAPALLSEVVNGVGGVTGVGLALDVVVEGFQAFISGGFYDSIVLLDVTDPSNPVQIADARAGFGNITDLGTPRQLAIEGSFVLAACEGSDTLTAFSAAPGGLGLDVFGDTIFRGAIYDNKVSNGAVGAALTSTGNGVEWKTQDISTILGFGNNAAGQQLVNVNRLGIGQGSTPAKVTIKGGNTGETDGILLEQSIYKSRLYHSSDGDLIIRKDNQTDQLVIDSGGNVGIGTSTPSSKLEVNGTVTATAFSGDGSALTGITDQDDTNELNTALALNGTMLDLTDAGGTLSADLTPLQGSFFGDNHSLDASDGDPVDRVFVGETGLVGVHNTAPQAQLHVGTAGSFTLPAPVQISSTPRTPGTLHDLHVDGTEAFLALGDGVYVYDISNPASPAFLSTILPPSGGSIWGVFLSGNALYFTEQNLEGHFHVADVTDPSSPVVNQIAENNMNGFNDLKSPSEIVVSGSLAYIVVIGGANNFGLTVVDISDPANPVELDTYIYTGSVFRPRLQVSNNVAWLGYPSAFVLVDVSNPNSLTEFTEENDGVNGFDDIAGDLSASIQGNLIFIASRGDDAITIADISDPANPTVLAVIRNGVSGITGLDAPTDIDVVGGIAHVISEDNNALTLIDVSSPTNYRMLSTISNSSPDVTNFSSPTRVDVSGGHIYAWADSSERLSVFDTSGTATEVGVIVEGPIDPRGGFQLSSGPAPVANNVLVATGDGGKVEWAKPFPSGNSNTQLTSIDANGITGFRDIGPTTNINGLRAGDRILIMGSFTFRINGGSGSDDPDFRFSATGPSTNTFSDQMGGITMFDQHRGDWFPVSLHRVVQVGEDGDFGIRLQVNTSNSDDILEFRRLHLTAIRL